MSGILCLQNKRKYHLKNVEKQSTVIYATKPKYMTN